MRRRLRTAEESVCGRLVYLQLAVRYAKWNIRKGNVTAETWHKFKPCSLLSGSFDGVPVLHGEPRQQRVTERPIAALISTSLPFLDS